MNTEEYQLASAVCEVGRRMYAKNFVAATDGNISVRLGPGRYLCTPSGVSKGFMQPGDMIIASEKGEKLEGSGKVTSEFFTHLAFYDERPDVMAVCHAHPPAAVACTLAGIPLDGYILPEMMYTIGAIPVAPYATPGTREGAESLRSWARACDAILLDRHGAVTAGINPFDAFMKMERVEHSCKTLATAHMLGSVRTLEPGQVEKLKALRTAYGVTGRAWYP